MSAKLRGRLRSHLAFWSASILSLIILLGLDLGATRGAQAHATLVETATPAASYFKAAIRIPHGCDGAATREVRVTIPEGFVQAKPQPKPGWTIAVKRAAYAQSYKLHGRPISEGVVEVIWSGGTLPDDQFEEFAVHGFVGEQAAGKALAFATTQQCDKGSIAWTQIPAPGQDAHALKSPAPLLKVAQVNDSHGMHAASTPSKDAIVPSSSINLGDLTINAPWARATPGGAKVAGGYLKVTNHGKESDRLVGAESVVAGRIEIHEMVMSDGIMKMRPRENGLEIKPGETVEFKSGGFHMMFMDLKEPLKEGQPIKARLTFAKSGTIEITFDVRDVGGQKSGGSSGNADHSKHR